MDPFQLRDYGVTHVGDLAKSSDAYRAPFPALLRRFHEHHHQPDTRWLAARRQVAMWLYGAAERIDPGTTWGPAITEDEYRRQGG